MSDYNYAPLKRFSVITITLLSLFGYGYFVFAAPNLLVTPVGGYNPGTELDPVCPPNQLLPEPCIVKTPSGSTYLAGTGLTLTGTTFSLTPVGTAGTYGSATQVPVFTTDAQGRVTGVTNTTITPAVSSLTGAANVTAGSTKVTLGGTPTGAVLKAFSVDVNEANLSLQNIGGALSVTQQNAINFSNVSGSVNLASQVSGILPVANGGTGQSSLTTGSLLVGNGTSPVSLLGAGTNGQVLTIVAGSPAWAAAGASSGWALTGNAGTTAGTNFIGTTDAQDFVMKVNNVEVGRFTAADRSSFIGYQAGQNSTNTLNSIFLGHQAGENSINAQESTFVGPYAGQGSIGADHSTFSGYLAGKNSMNASNTVFSGSGSGFNSSLASFAVFVGHSTGVNSINTAGSVFIGFESGYNVNNSGGSVFTGYQAGYNADNAAQSILVGFSAGAGSIGASNSIFLGTNAGYADIVDNTTSIDDFSILIGNNTNTGGFSNSIALGSYATNTATNQFMIGSTTKPINTTRFQGAVLGTQCTITTGTGIACTSDERLKKNITDISKNTLDALMNIRTVHYNLIGDVSGRNQIGFLAQNLEQYFPELVDTNSDGYKSVYYAQMTPILTEAIRELNLRLTTIESLADNTVFKTSLLSMIQGWLADAGNGIESIFTRKVTTQELCVGSRCVTEDQFNQLLDQAGISNSSANSTQPVTNTPSANDNGGSSTINDTTTGINSSDATDNPFSSPSENPSDGTSSPVVDSSDSSSTETISTPETTPVIDNVSPTEAVTP